MKLFFHLVLKQTYYDNVRLRFLPTSKNFDPLYLKTKYKKQFNEEAKGLLEKTDWYVIKATDVESYSVPSDISTYRTQVRAKVNSMETDIDNCSTVEELITLLTYTIDSEGVSSRPLGEFPDEVV